jgi:hypothetical protein
MTVRVTLDIDAAGPTILSSFVESMTAETAPPGPVVPPEPDLIPLTSWGTIYADIPADGVTDAVAALAAIVESAPDGATIKLPFGTVLFNSDTRPASDAWTLAGHSNPDAPGGVCIPIFGRKGLTIDLTGTTIVRGDGAMGHGFLVYGSQGIRIIGGEARGCSMRGAKYASAFGHDAAFIDCHSRDAGRQGVEAQHYRFDGGENIVRGGSIVETSNQSTGDAVDGIQVAAPGSWAAQGLYPSARIEGVCIRGTRDAIKGLGADRVVAAGNDIAGYFRAGISLYSRNIGGTAYRMNRVRVEGNIIGSFAPSSMLVETTWDRKAGVQIENMTALPIQGVFAGNLIDANAGGTITPTGNWFEVRTVAASVVKSANDVIGTGTVSLA